MEIIMADEDVIIDEIEAEPIQTASGAIGDLINYISNQDFVSAESQFNDLVGSRLQDTLDQARIKISDEIFNAQQDLDDDDDNDDEEIEVDLSDIDLDDEDLDDDSEV
jgi:hypothetical protein